jgi:hypothetical protein
MNTSSNKITLICNEKTNAYLKNVHEISYLQRLKKINSRENIFLNTNPMCLNNNNYNSVINHTTKNATLPSKLKEHSSKFCYLFLNKVEKLEKSRNNIFHYKRLENIFKKQTVILIK